MTILTQEQLSTIKSSFRKGVYAVSLLAALMMVKPTESRASIPIDEKRIERVKLTSPEQINQIVNEFFNGVGLHTSVEGMKLNISLPEKAAEYVARGVKELTDSQKEILYDVLREELKSVPESERLAFCMLIAGYCGRQFGPEDFNINFPTPKTFPENKLVGPTCRTFGEVLLEMGKAKNKKPNIFVKPAQDSIYQRTPEQLGYFRNLIIEKFPQMTDGDDQRFEEHKENLYKFEWIMTGAPARISEITTKEQLAKSIGMSEEQVRELITMRSTNPEIANIWIKKILNGHLPGWLFKDFHDIPVSRLVMIGGAKGINWNK